MIRKTLSRLALPVIATAVLLAASSPAFAQRGGRGGGGFHTGGVRVGGYSGYRGTVYHGGYGGYNYGYHPYSGYNTYRPYYGGYGVYPSYGTWSYPSYGSWYYPYYGYDPYFDSSYIAPSISDTTTEASNPPAQPTAAINATTPATDASTGRPSQISDAVSNTARITVRLPDMAELWFDGTMSTATGPVREFTTPSLTPGQKYTYEVRARWLEDDTFRDQTQTITFAPGDKIEVNFPKLPEIRKPPVTP